MKINTKWYNNKKDIYSLNLKNKSFSAYPPFQHIYFLCFSNLPVNHQIVLILVYEILRTFFSVFLKISLGINLHSDHYCLSTHLSIVILKSTTKQLGQPIWKYWLIWRHLNSNMDSIFCAMQDLELWIILQFFYSVEFFISKTSLKSKWFPITSQRCVLF